jgi:bifunctional enzyme CysN/CysC
MPNRPARLTRADVRPAGGQRPLTGPVPVNCRHHRRPRAAAVDFPGSLENTLSDPLQRFVPYCRVGDARRWSWLEPPAKTASAIGGSAPGLARRSFDGLRLVAPMANDMLEAAALRDAASPSRCVTLEAPCVDKAARATLKDQRPCVVWFTGLSGAGKSTIAAILERRLHGLGRHTYVIDGDAVRQGLSKDLGFSDGDRVENIRRVTEVSRLMADAGLIVLVSCISPFRADRRSARARLEEGEFFEVFVDTPLAVAEARDPKGLYRRARRGELRNFTGIDSPYEAPEGPELRLDTTRLTADEAADVVVAELQRARVIA